MFVYLSKKIAIPNNSKIYSLSWNKEQGYIAVGGDDGLLKVLKLGQASTHKGNFTAAASNLSMNQTLEGHKSAVQVVVWNEFHKKLTTADREGVIIVWMLYKGSWYEEMTNDRKKSTVTGMTWSSDGQKICIVYEDGGVIVGSVDGTRIWNNTLKNTIQSVAFSPDAKLLLFSLKNGELHLYDGQGSFIKKLNVQCVHTAQTKHLSITGLSWFDGPVLKNQPNLGFCYENGRLQLMRSENDDNPIIVDTGLAVIDIKWNHNGKLLAVCGKNNLIAEKESNHVVFLSAFGNCLRVLKIPGNQASALTWDEKSLRIAVAVDSFIYFANVRSDYMFCCLGKTVIFFENQQKPDEYQLNFWDTGANKCFLKKIETPLGISAFGNNCVIATEVNLKSNRDANNILDISDNGSVYQLQICNSIGTTIDAKYTDMKPIYIAMNKIYVIISDHQFILFWQYRTTQTCMDSVKIKKDIKIHINDIGATQVLDDLDRSSLKTLVENVALDKICAIAASEKYLLIGREKSCVVHIYKISTGSVVLCNRSTLKHPALKIEMNCNSTKAAVIDVTGQLTIFDLNESSTIDHNISRKDVWAITWAKDFPSLLAIMEKTRLYIIKGNGDPEEPISCSGYICNFEGLEISAVSLDNIIDGNIPPNTSDHLEQIRIKSLRDTENLLAHVGIAEAKIFVEDNSHSRLWKILAEASLKKKGELLTAETSFAKCNNYFGLQLIKKIKYIENQNLKKAEISIFYADFDEAEKIYIDENRRDLALGLRQKLCDWFCTVSLLCMYPKILDQQIEMAWKEIGSSFASTSSWENALEYYEKAQCTEGKINAFYQLEQYDELEKTMDNLPDNHSFHTKLGLLFASVGMCSQAVSAYMKISDVKSAVDVSISLKQWSLGLQLAQRHKMPQINTLLAKHAAQLKNEKRLLEAVELQRKAGRFLYAARLLIELADEEIMKKSGLLRIKKIFILAGLLAEEYLQTKTSIYGTRALAITHLHPEEAMLIEKIWHSAEGYHFFILAQEQLQTGLINSALLTSIRLREYEDILNVEEIYCLIALMGIANQCFSIASKAFIKLSWEGIITEKKRFEYEDLAVIIFSKFEPFDAIDDHINQMKHCNICDKKLFDWSTSCDCSSIRFPACVVTGQTIINLNEIWQCKRCFRFGIRQEMSECSTCPLCHTLI